MDFHQLYEKAKSVFFPPCGSCREFISQFHDENFKAEVMVSEGKIVTLKELLPHDWREIQLIRKK